VVRQSRAALRIQFEDAGLAEAGMHGERRAQQLERRAHADRRHVLAFHFGRADHVEIVLLRRDIQRVARMQQAHRPRQLDTGRMHAATSPRMPRNVGSTDFAPKPRQSIVMRAGRQRMIVDRRVPVCFDTALGKARSERGQAPDGYPVGLRAAAASPD
jgi:hypothetical protein